MSCKRRYRCSCCQTLLCRQSGTERGDEKEEDKDDDEEVEVEEGGLTDSDCTWDYGEALLPSEICEYAYKFVIHLGMSCRLKSKAEIEASLQTLKDYLGHKDEEEGSSRRGQRQRASSHVGG